VRSYEYALRTFSPNWRYGSERAHELRKEVDEIDEI
jgi:hypothetical protein